MYSHTSQITGVVLAQGATSCGCTEISRAARYETPRMAARREALPFAATHAVVAAFSHFAGDSPGNIPLYARGENYHAANLRRLERACAVLRTLFPENGFHPSGNGYPLPAVQAARLAGIGKIGVNGLVIIPGTGTRHTIGAILTDLPLAPGAEEGYCERCGACVSACPFGALSLDGDGWRFDKEYCVSHVGTLKELTPAQEDMVRRGGWVMWCDACQNACPHNGDVGRTLLPEYLEGLVAEVTPETLADMAPDRRPYENRELLARNLALRAGSHTLSFSEKKEYEKENAVSAMP